MKSKEFALGLVVGLILVITTTAIAKGIVDVRSGPAATISVATSADGLTVYVANPSGIYKSTNGGETWRSLPVE